MVKTGTKLAYHIRLYNLTEYMKQLLSGRQEQVAQDCDDGEKGNTQGERGDDPILC